MSATSLALRALGVIFNAFVSRRLGADGMGLFTLIMSVYGLAVTLAAAGINLAATRMCAEAIGRGDDGALRASLKRCFIYAVSCGLGAALLLFFGAELVASQWLGDVRCTRSLRLLAVSLPFIAASNVVHGYFTAVRKVSKTAATQIFEQLFKTLVTVLLLLYIVPEGIEYACMALVGGGALAETVSFTAAFILYAADVRKRRRDVCGDTRARGLTREMLGITVPVAAAACIRSGLTTLEHILIPQGLRKNPASADTALAAYGVFCGMVMPVIMFPSALLYSFTGLLIPEFAEAHAAGNHRRMHSMITRALGMTLIFSVGCACVMTCFANELGYIIYASSDAGQFIGIMAPLIPIMYLDHAVDAILKGLGEQIYCMKVNILDAAVCTFLVWVLCPRIGIYGYIVTIYLAEVMNASLSVYRLAKVCPFEADIKNTLLKPIVSAVGTICILRFSGMPAAASGFFGLVVGIVFAVALYVLLLCLMDGRHSVRRIFGRN